MGSAIQQGQLWGARAEVWAYKVEPMNAPLWRAMLDACEVEPATNLLDVGCGAGGLCQIAIGLGAQVSGFDASERLLEIARIQVPGASFEVGDLQFLPFADNEFGVVTACNSIQFADDQQKAVAEVRRVLKPGGRFAICMWCEPDRCEMNTVFEAVKSVAPPPPTHGDPPPTLNVRDNLVRLVESAGFKLDKDGEVECVFEFSDDERAWQGIRSAGMMEAVSRAIGEDTLRSAVVGAFEGFRLPDGKVRFRNWFRYLVVR